MSLDKNEFNNKAGKIVNRILDEHQVLPMDEDIVRKGDDIIKAYEEKYAG